MMIRPKTEMSVSEPPIANTKSAQMQKYMNIVN